MRHMVTMNRGEAIGVSKPSMPVLDSYLDLGNEPRLSRAYLRLFLAAAAVGALLLAGSLRWPTADVVGTGSTGAVADARAEVAAPVFPATTAGLAAMMASFEEVQVAVDEAINDALAAAEVASQQGDQARASGEAAATSRSHTSVSTGSAQASSSVSSDVAVSAEASGESTSSSSISNSSSSVSNSGGSSVTGSTSGSGSASVSTGSQTAGPSSCVGEVFASGDPAAMGASIRQAVESC